MTGISKVWKGAFVGALIGGVSLVFTGTFKGNLGEPEFLAHYIGYLIPATAIGALVGWRKQRGQILEQQTRKSYAFVIAVVVLSLAMVSKVAMDFPNGEGLFHPTHSANLAEANKICLEKIATDVTASQEVKESYCSCWADHVVHTAEMDSPPPPTREEAQRIDATCRQQFQPAP